MSWPSHLLFDYPNNIWWKVKMMKIILMQFSPVSDYSLLWGANILLSALFSDVSNLYIENLTSIWQCIFLHTRRNFYTNKTRWLEPRSWEWIYCVQNYIIWDLKASLNKPRVSYTVNEMYKRRIMLNIGWKLSKYRKPRPKRSKMSMKSGLWHWKVCNTGFNSAGED